MAWTKGDIAKQAFAEMGLAAYVFDLTPDELIGAVQRLDMLMGTLNRRGVRLGYAMSSSAAGADPATDSGLPDEVIEGVVAMLSCRLAPGYGKTVSEDTKATAREARDSMLAKAVDIPSMQMPPTMPMGAAYKRRPTRPFYPQPSSVAAGNDGELVFE